MLFPQQSPLGFQHLHYELCRIVPSFLMLVSHRQICHCICIRTLFPQQSPSSFQHLPIELDRILPSNLTPICRPDVPSHSTCRDALLPAIFSWLPTPSLPALQHRSIILDLDKSPPDLSLNSMC